MELARDARRKAQEAKDDQENFWSQGALSAGYRKELGLNMGQIRFEVGNPITLHFSTGGYPDDLVTELCKGGAGGSHVLFWEIGGRYSYNFRQWTLGAGLSTNMTYFSLDDTEDKGKTDESAKKNLKVWSLGPNATVRYAITERLSASVGGGLRVRGYDPNRFGYYGSIGLTFTL